jgi:membrane protease subunit HflK
LIQEAEAYEAQKVAQAKGDTERFEQLLTEYEKAPAITRKRLYLEATEKLYSSANKVLVDSPQGASPAFYLPLQQTAPNANAGVPTASNPAVSNPAEKAAVGNNKSELRPSRSKP